MKKWYIISVRRGYPSEIGAFPQFFIELPVNAVFLIMIGLLYGLTLFVYIMISKHNEEIINLTYEISVLKKELDELKKKK